jgi:hypothetical protein
MLVFTRSKPAIGLATALLVGGALGALESRGAIAAQNPLVPKVIKIIPIPPATAGSYWPAVNHKTNRIYVANGGQASPGPNQQNGAGSSVTVIDGNTDTIIDTIGIPVAVTLPGYAYPPGPTQIAIDEDANTLYMATNNGAIAVVDGATDQVTAFFVVDTMSSGPDGLSLRSIVRSKKTGKVYVSNSTNEIDVIDPQMQTVLKRIPNSAAGPLSIDQSLNRVYTSANAGTGAFNGVMVIDGDTDEVETIIPTFGVGIEGSAVDESLHHLYVAGEGSGFVTIDTMTNKVINAKTAWARSFAGYGMDVDVGNHGVYSVGEISNLMTVIDGSKGEIVGYDIQIGFVCPPAASNCFPPALGENLAVNSVTGKIYVADFGLAAWNVPGGGPSEIVVLQLPKGD